MYFNRFKFNSILFIFSILFFTSCEDPEINELMEDYCNCISEAQTDEYKREECIEKMESIQKEYGDDAVKMNKIIQKTNNCH